MVRYVLTDEDSPGALRELCLLYCVKNYETFCELDRYTGRYNLKDGVSLPPEICESLLDTYVSLGRILEDNFLHVFEDPMRTHLRKVNVQDTDVTEKALLWLMRHKPHELDISGCKNVSSKTLEAINQYGKNLVKLFVGHCPFNLQNIIVKDKRRHQPSARGDAGDRTFGVDYIFDCPEVRAFSVYNLDNSVCPAHEIIATAIHPFKKLSHLDLSMCSIEVQNMDCWKDLVGLSTLILYNVPLTDVHGSFKQISRLKNLR